MSMTQVKARPRRTDARANRPAVPARAVRGLLLELSYRLHATRVVGKLPEGAGAVRD
jgi:hypothetical protein